MKVIPFCMMILNLGIGHAAIADTLVVAEPKSIDNLPSVLSDRLGLAFPGKDKRHYAALEEAGLGVVRLGVSWADREPKQGKYDWIDLDRQIVALQNRGIKPFLTLYPDAPWGVRDLNSPVKNKRPKDIKAWQIFVGNLVERYDGDGQQDAPGLKTRVLYYQVANEWISNQNRSGGWNGTADELINFVNVSYDAVKRADSGALFVLGGIAAFNLDIMSMLKGISHYPAHQKFSAESSITISSYMLDSPSYKTMQNDVYKVLELSKYDYADVHLYGETRRNQYRIEAIRQHTNRPLLSSECGGPSLDYRDSYKSSEHFTAVFDWNLSSLSHNLVFCLWFQLGESQGSTWGNRKVALFDTAQEPKPGFHAYHFLSHMLQGVDKVDYIREGVYKLTYQSGDTLVVAWNGSAAINSATAEISVESLNGFLNIDNKGNSENTLQVVRITDVEQGLYSIENVTGNFSLILKDVPVIVGKVIPKTLAQ